MKRLEYSCPYVDIAHCYIPLPHVFFFHPLTSLFSYVEFINEREEEITKLFPVVI